MYFVRGEKVFLDADLAMLYGVETSALNRAVKRNPDRFPADFMFQLDAQEWENLRCQIWHLKFTWRAAGYALCFYRTGCGYAL